MTTPKSSKLGLIVRSDLGSGLQSQTYNLARMLKPDRVLHINSQSFNGREQHPEMYEGFTGFSTKGFPDNRSVTRFLDGLTHVLTAETFYSYEMVRLANIAGIKTFNQCNYEFLDNLREILPVPYSFLLPSHWHEEEMANKFPNVHYLPPPIFTNDFKEAREVNFKRSGYRRFVHIVGKQAEHDRNGTEDLLHAIEFSDKEFELVIRSQYPLPYTINDRRVTFDIGNKLEQGELYKDFDALIMPRRYGGLCLPMNEALCSGLPVIMTDISPNNRILPESWLAQARVVKQFMARTPIDVYTTDLRDLARRIDDFATMSDKDLQEAKGYAWQIGFDEFDSDSLKPKYMELMGL